MIGAHLFNLLSSESRHMPLNGKYQKYQNLSETHLLAYTFPKFVLLQYEVGEGEGGRLLNLLVRRKNGE